MQPVLCSMPLAPASRGGGEIVPSRTHTHTHSLDPLRFCYHIRWQSYNFCIICARAYCVFRSLLTRLLPSYD